MGKQKQGNKAPYRMKAYHTIEVEKKWKVQDMITHVINKTQKGKKTISDNISTSSSIQKSTSTSSDTGSECEQQQQFILLTSDKCFELNSDYYCKDLMLKNDFFHLIDKFEMEQQVKQQANQEEYKQLESQLENIKLNEKPLESTETLQENQNKEEDDNSPFEKLESVLPQFDNDNTTQIKPKNKKLSQQFELEDWEVMADQSKKNSLENIKENQDNSEDYETYDEEQEKSNEKQQEDQKSKLQIQEQESDFTKKSQEKTSKENQEDQTQI